MDNKTVWNDYISSESENIESKCRSVFKYEFSHILLLSTLSSNISMYNMDFNIKNNRQV